MYACRCGGLHPQGSRCPSYRKPSGRKGSTRKWRKTRERVLARDGHCCQVCGDTVTLEVHHLVDWAQGGTDEDSNLETRCFLHNPRGRGESAPPESRDPVIA